MAAEHAWRGIARLVRSYLFPSAVAILLACSDSGEDVAPELQNLYMTPQVATRGDGNGSVPVIFSVNVSDPDADVSHLAIVVLVGSTRLQVLTGTITNPRGLTRGLLAGTLSVSTATAVTYTFQFQVFDAHGHFSNILQTTVTILPGNPIPAIASLSPSRANAGGPPLTLTVTGSGFLPSSQVLFGGANVTTTYVGTTKLEAQISSYALSLAGVYDITVSNPPPGGGPSSPATFTVDPQPPNPVPTLASISPSTAQVGDAPFTLTATGTDFVWNAIVEWDGHPLATTFVDATTLHATVPDNLLAGAGGPVAITVVNPAPGGGTSAAATFTLMPQPGVTFVSLAANDLAWDPFQQRIYLSVPSLSPMSPNTITVLDPFTGTLSGSQPAGTDPGELAVSDDGQFLYVAFGGAGSVDRLVLPALTQDLSVPLGSDPVYGPYSAGDLAVAPSAPHTFAVWLHGQGGTPPGVGGIVVYDDATARPTRATGRLYDSIQWGSGANVIYAANGGDFPLDLYVFSVDALGVALAKDYPSAFSFLYDVIHFDAGNGFVYSDHGRALDPSTGASLGTFSTARLGLSTKMIPDSSLRSAFFVGQTGTAVTVEAFDIATFASTRSMMIPLAYPPRSRLLRWGPDGLAYLDGSRVVLVRGPIVLPVSDTPNPTPAVASLSPSSTAAGSGNLKVAVSGSGFVPGSVVQWNASDRSTRYASATSLVAYIPASDLASAGPQTVTVRSPSPGGGASAAATFTVNP